MTPKPDFWWQTGVIYQIYPRSFADSNGDGIGDLDGITSRLDYLSQVLGVDALWLSPFYPSPQADFGYDVSDYCAVDPMFGDLAAFDRLVGEAHRRNLRVIIDFVPNHSSDQHPWFVESRSSRTNPKRGWYVWRDGRPNRSPPNNWLSVFGGGAWEPDAATGQWYLHSFLKEQPDLDWRNPEVEAAMHDVLRFWMRRGVDGFRIDVAHFVMKDPELRDNPPAPPGGRDLAWRPPSAYDAFEHLHDQGHPDVHEAFRRMRSVLDEFEPAGPRFSVGEIHEFDWKQWAGYYGEHLDELHMPFNFVLLVSGVDPAKIRAAIEGLEAALPPGAWPGWVYGNHDEPRIATRLGQNQSRAAAMLLLTLRGTPTIYYGDELGMPEAEIPPGQQQDPYGIRVPGMSRDGCRAPMQWTAGPGAGFSPPGAAPAWLPIQDHSTINVESELADPASHLNLYKRLLSVRRAEPSLQVGDITLLDGLPKGCLGYRRGGEGGRPVTVVLNLSAVPVATGLTGDLLISTQWADPDPGKLRPWEAVVLA